ncbi:MAG: hypothetical protein IV090_02420 [Candidatus Sericytochromatia bacterium]|nr:hypothetical protein [Candidatus Sericytochromatia bacterium]
MQTVKRLSLTFLLGCLVFTPAMPMYAEPSFPFSDVQQLNHEQLQVQKYKLQRLRIKQMQSYWLILRGINEKIDDLTLLKMVNHSEILDEINRGQMIGNGVALGGLGLAGAGGLMMGNVIKFNGSFWVGLAAIILGAGMAITGEMMAGNIGDEFSHILEQPQAERFVAEYNDELKKQLGIAHIPNLD